MQLNDFRKQKDKGFTLIELAISSAILTIIFGGMTIFGINTVKSYKRTQALKNTIEDARYAIEILNKTIRTSNNIEGKLTGGSDIFIKDNNTNSGHCYRFNSIKKTLERKIGVNDCDGTTGFTDIVGGDNFNDIEVTGLFYVKPTDINNEKRGFVRTSIKLTYPVSGQDNFEDDVFQLQSSVSLRDYGLETSS